MDGHDILAVGLPLLKKEFHTRWKVLVCYIPSLVVLKQ